MTWKKIKQTRLSPGPIPPYHVMRWKTTSPSRNRNPRTLSPIPSLRRITMSSSEYSAETGTTSDDSWEATLINPIVQRLHISPTIEILGMVQQLQANDANVTSLCVGEPDFDVPQAVINAATYALMDGHTRYTKVRGTLQLRQAIAADIQRRKGLHYDAVSQILVANGAKQCIYQGILSTCGVNDVAIIPTPCWPSYTEMVSLAGASSTPPGCKGHGHHAARQWRVLFDRGGVNGCMLRGHPYG